ncbi:hypothetical protein GCM10027614_76050 [Micromonospora vulcania]
MNNLTDRYLAATLRSVPTQRREEIATELRASIEDMIEARTDDGQDAATAEREVLTELGNPDQLAARYADRRLQLLGPTYYLVWLRLLKLLLSFIPALVGVIVAVVEAAEGKGPGSAIGTGIGTALEVAVHIAFWLTLTFVLIDRFQPTADLPVWTVDQLPPHRCTGTSPSPTPSRRCPCWRWSSATCPSSTTSRGCTAPTAATSRSSTRRSGRSGCRR